jgi:hypothetical protein
MKTASDDNADTNNVETYTASKAMVPKPAKVTFAASAADPSQALENYLDRPALPESTH